MKKRLLLGSALVLLLAAYPLLSPAQEEATSVLVYDIKAEAGVSKELAKVITEAFLAELRKNRSLKVIAQNEIATLLQREAQKQLLGECDSSSCMVELAGSLGAQKIIVGHIAKVEEAAIINIKMLNGESIEVERQWMKTVNSLDQKIFLDYAIEAAKMMTKETSAVSPVVTEETLRCPPNMAFIKGGKAHIGTKLFDKPRDPSDLMYRTHNVAEFCIDRYEFPNEKGKPPKSNVSFEMAQSLCEESGKRLCSEMEWELACRTTSNNMYPYGGFYSPKKCVTKSKEETATAIMPSGSKPDCAGETGVFDLSGNLAEWVIPALGGKTAAKGGSAISSGKDARCASRNSDPKPNLTGFRCCADAASKK
ncbi:MAG: hypothetical protein Kow0090_22220 [Myxococcota bacterium]